MTPLRQAFIRELALRGMAPRTQESYIDAVRKLAEHYHLPPDVRLNEACHLRIEDINGERHQLRIVQAKGNKDRYALLPPRLLEELSQLSPAHAHPGRDPGPDPTSGSPGQFLKRAQDASAHRGPIHTLARIYFPLRTPPSASRLSPTAEYPPGPGNPPSHHPRACFPGPGGYSAHCWPQ